MILPSRMERCVKAATEQIGEPAVTAILRRLAGVETFTRDDVFDLALQGVLCGPGGEDCALIVFVGAWEAHVTAPVRALRTELLGDNPRADRRAIG